MQYRLEIAFVLDELGWLSENFYSCVLISAANNHDFQIGKNLVSNQQYQRFLDAPDYGDPNLWQHANCQSYSGRLLSLNQLALRWLNNKIGDDRLPKSWNDSTFGIAHPGVPIVGISWFEANAYCNWLLKHWAELEEAKFNPNLKPKAIRLPTENEWNIAVFHLSGKHSNMSFADSISNLTVHANVGSFLNRTSPIGMFSQGLSFPDGLVDAIGNVR